MDQGQIMTYQIAHVIQLIRVMKMYLKIGMPMLVKMDVSKF